MRKIFAVVIVIVIVLLLNLLYVFGESSNIESVKMQRQKIKEELSNVNEDKKKNQAEVNELKESEDVLQKQQDEKNRQIHVLTSEILRTDKEVENLSRKIEQAQEKYDKELSNYKKRLLIMCQNSEMFFINTLIQSKDLFEFYQKIDIMAKITRRDKELLKNLNLSKKEIKYNKRILEELKKDKEQKAREVKESLTQIMTSQENVKKEVDKRLTTIQLLEKMEDELDKESLNLESIIKNMTLSGEYAGGNMIWPTPSSKRISSIFGPRIHPIYGTKRFHTGLDIAADYDASIVSVNGGQVFFAGWRSGYGNTVIIFHGSKIVTLYAHCSRIIVNEGDMVKTGDVIAKVGSTGASTGNHLHFEVRVNGLTENPLKYLSIK